MMTVRVSDERSSRFYTENVQQNYCTYKKLKSLPALLRGSLYTAGFYLAEFASGSILQAFHMCPWDYSGVPHQYKGIIRLDYLPVWFLTGLFFEKILTKSS